MIDWSYWIDRAKECENAGKYDEAIGYYSIILEDNPEDTFALTNIGACFSRSGQFDLAVTYLDKATDIKPWDSFLWFNKGVIYYENKRYGQAITFFDKAISFDENDAYSWSFKAFCHEELMDIPKAIECFEISYNINHDERILDFINELKQAYPYIRTNHNSSSSMKQCPVCGRSVNEAAISCGFCGHRFVSGSPSSASSSSSSVYGKKQCPSCGRMVSEIAISCGFCGHRFVSGSPSSASSSSSSVYGKKQCPDCGRMVNEFSINCGFCGYSFTGGTGITKKCPNCGTAVRKNKKVCPKCNYNFKKSKVDEPKNLKTNGGNKKVSPKNIRIKHFDNDIVSFDYPDIYSKDYNSKYEKLDIIASFKTGSQYDYDSAFAIFQGEPITDEIIDSKFKEVIKKSLDSDVLNIKRYSIEEKERIIIKTQNKTNGNTEYLCNVPELGFSILFVIPVGKDYLFDEKWVSTIVDSLEKSTGKSFSKKEVISKKEVKVCPNCGAENSDDSNFCIECGVKLDVAKGVNFCIHCGTEVVPGAKFCMNCGKLIED